MKIEVNTHEKNMILAPQPSIRRFWLCLPTSAPPAK